MSVKKLGLTRLCDLQAYEIQTFYGGLSQKGLSARTVRYVHNVISSALKQAVKWKLLSQNPCELCELPKQIRKEMKYLSAEEISNFLNVAKDNKWFVLFLVAIESGMRPEEYLGLQWKDIDFPNQILSVKRVAIRKKGGGFYFTEPKQNLKRREAAEAYRFQILSSMP